MKAKNNCFFSLWWLRNPGGAWAGRRGGTGAFNFLPTVFRWVGPNCLIHITCLLVIPCWLMANSIVSCAINILALLKGYYSSCICQLIDYISSLSIASSRCATVDNNFNLSLFLLIILSLSRVWEWKIV